MSLALNIYDAVAYERSSFGHQEKGYSTIETSFQEASAALIVSMKNSNSYSFTSTLLEELLHFSRNSASQGSESLKMRALMSRSGNVFSLGGDLGFFRDSIAHNNREELENYAATAVELIWESITASGMDGVASVAVVQGEAQGGGFEAALASHILIAERGACFGFPEGLFGLFPGMGARALLCARGAAARASAIIGSARRYKAEELYAMGVVDFLAEPGEGLKCLGSVAERLGTEKVEELRARFDDITKSELLGTVAEWVDLALKLPQKHLRTIDYLIQAQERISQKFPTIRVI